MARTYTPMTFAQSSGFSILVVDDQAEVLSATRSVLEGEGHHVLTATSGEEALAILRSSRVQLILVDYFMPGMDGEALIRNIQTRDTGVQILLQTGYAPGVPPQHTLRLLDIQGYHEKSDGPDRLRLWVEVALKAYLLGQKARDTEQLTARLQQKEELVEQLEELVAERTAELIQAKSELEQTVIELQQVRQVVQRVGYVSSAFSLVHKS